MKKLFIVLSIFVLLSCAALQEQPAQPQTVTHILRIEGVENVKVQTEPNVISRHLEVEQTELELSNLTRVYGDTAFMKLYAGLGMSDQVNLWFDHQCLKHKYPDVKKIFVYLNSGGGNAFTGLGLADFFDGIRDTYDITVHATGIIASAAVPVFAACDHRIASPGTFFMVHEASLFKWGGSESYSDIKAQREMMELLRNRYLETMAKHTNLTADEWGELEGNTTWFNAGQAKEWGLVDKIE